MNWNFFKTNWFYLCMAVVLLVYGLRKYPSLNPFSPTLKGDKTEKVTDSKRAKKGAAALLGFVPDTPREQPLETTEAEGAKTEAFLKRFAHVALSEHKKFGTPTSVILAAAYANSQAGQKEAALTANNFFSLSCAEDWEGESTKINGQCMRKYESAWASFRDFSIYLSGQEWFGSLKKSAGKDARKWAEKFGSEGVSNTKAMLKIIDAYGLDELDEP